MRYLYMEQIIVFYCQYRAASHAKQAVLIPKPVLFLLATQCPGVCCPLETIFLVILKFNCWWETFIPLQKNVEPWLPERSWVMTDDVSFGWDHTSCSQVFSCKQFGDFFLDRGEMFVLHPSTKNPDSCQALLNFIEWWLMTSHLNEVIQVAARSSAASNSVIFFSTDERCSFLNP